jgi:hypothetical protein
MRGDPNAVMLEINRNEAFSLRMSARLDSDEKGVANTDTLGGQQEMLQHQHKHCKKRFSAARAKRTKQPNQVSQA